MLYKDALIVIDYIRKTGKRLTDWEISFIRRIEYQRAPLTKKQEESLNGIYARVYGGGLYEKKERV